MASVASGWRQSLRLFIVAKLLRLSVWRKALGSDSSYCLHFLVVHAQINFLYESCKTTPNIFILNPRKSHAFLLKKHAELHCAGFKMLTTN